MSVVRPAVERLSCFRSRRIFSLALDGGAEAAELHQLALHLGSCRSCRTWGARVAAITRELRMQSNGSGSEITQAEGGRS